LLGRPRCLRGPFRVLIYSTDLGGCADDAPTVAELDGNLPAVATVIAMLSLLSADPAAAEKRVALVVGNSAYQNVT
jgi:hypothetical protein